MKIAHVVPLRAVGGVERSYSEFIAFRDPAFPIEHHTIALGRGIPPLLDARIRAASGSVALGHYRGTEHIPFSPGALRERHLEAILGELRPDLALFWNKPGGVALERLPDSLPVVYWERGRAWKEKEEDTTRRFLGGVRAVLCNSRASRRFLELRWQLPESVEVRICENAVRPEAVGPTADRSLCADQPLRLGFAGRLVAVKGASLTLHAVAELRRRGRACELLIAGEGPERAALGDLVGRLGLAGQVHFLGLVDDMPGFFREVDCLLCPSLREPFGLVAAEAFANGCPVVATHVDGLAEVVDDRRVGRSVVPLLPLARYRDYGGDPDDVPPRIYDPVEDALVPPRVPDPDRLADAVLELVDPPERFGERSRLARELAAKRFDFGQHVRGVLSILAEIAELPASPARG